MCLKTVSTGVAFLAIAAGTLVMTSTRGEAANDKNATQDEKLKIQIGQQIVPTISLNLRGKDSDTVYLGSYLVNAIGCNDCHTSPNYIGNPFAGDPIRINAVQYMAGGRAFGPGVVSRNITPDVTGRPAGLSYTQFAQAMRNGVDFDNIHPLLQTMPWPRYRYLTDRDMQSIYEYLSSIPCLEGDPGVSTAPTHRCTP
jgi:hypothetical protein